MGNDAFEAVYLIVFNLYEPDALRHPQLSF